MVSTVRRQLQERRSQRPRIGSSIEGRQRVMHIKFKCYPTDVRLVFQPSTKTDRFVRILRFWAIPLILTVASKLVNVLRRFLVRKQSRLEATTWRWFDIRSLYRSSETSVRKFVRPIIDRLLYVCRSPFCL